MKKTIAVGCDHAGFEFKDAIMKSLQAEGYTVKNFGTNSTEAVDYPDFVHPTCNAIENQEADLGLLFCGSANGVAITANKHLKIRAAIAWTDEISRLSRLHNDANVLCIPARFVSLDLAKSMVQEFLNSEFEGGRHQRRVDKISAI